MSYPGFRIDDAYRFVESHGLAADATRIRSLPIHPSLKRFAAAVRKGWLIELLERQGLMDQFVAAHWPAYESPSGQSRRERFLAKRASNDRRLEGEEDEDEEAIDAGNDVLSEEDEGASFVLEAQLRDFIADNISRVRIAETRLTLYKDSAGRLGIEYPTGVGPIDVLASDAEGGFWVFELKLERGPDRALGQLARYMGWVKHHLADGKHVRGVIVASRIDEKLRYAASVMAGIRLLEYEIEFRLKEALLAVQEPMNSRGMSEDASG